MNPVLIKVDRNGTKYFVDYTCPRCGGAGARDEWIYTGSICYECGGSGRTPNPHTYKEYTPEYAAKLDARRELREAKKLGFASVEAMKEARAREAARREAEQREREEREAAERKAEEERLAAIKAKSQYVGTPGEKLTVEVTYEGSPYYTRKVFYNTETVYLHKFRDADGNLIVWRTTVSGFGKTCDGEVNEGDALVVTATVKEHNEYKGEKQTLIIRAKVERR